MSIKLFKYFESKSDLVEIVRDALVDISDDYETNIGNDSNSEYVSVSCFASVSRTRKSLQHNDKSQVMLKEFLSRISDDIVRYKISEVGTTTKLDIFNIDLVDGLAFSEKTKTLYIEYSAVKNKHRSAFKGTLIDPGMSFTVYDSDESHQRKIGIQKIYSRTLDIRTNKLFADYIISYLESKNLDFLCYGWNKENHIKIRFTRDINIILV